MALIAIACTLVGTYGASNFSGWHMGVATRLKADHPTMVHVHCVVHCEALAAAVGAKMYPYLAKMFQPTVSGIYYFFQFSAVCKASLH